MKKHFEDGIEQLMFNESELIIALSKELANNQAVQDVTNKRAAMLRQSLKKDPSDHSYQERSDNQEKDQ
jgi:hypothetical protein